MLLSEQDDQDILKDAIAQTEDLFMVCVVGEFNAGKSKFINALLGNRWVEHRWIDYVSGASQSTTCPPVWCGNRYLKEGVTPTTAQICFIKHDSRKSQRTKYADPQGRLIDEVCVVVPYVLGSQCPCGASA